MTTPRNNLPALLMPLDTAMLEEIDAVYEIADAELASEVRIYEDAMRIIKANPKPQEQLAEMFLRHVHAIAKRDGLMAGVPEENFVAVAKQIAKDWDNTNGVDYRREQAAAAPESNPGL
ncbi:hypothetical protein RBE51_18015 [Pseudomonas taiwanensis]|uniref:hypothetical protein n=1 Tax=Pseudomonas taiwanensis TaxID=470150 RepID=UPI0028DE9CF5|nr:hypothetical protein [Pseudomonas taiwanensis]MDT8924708.1 hypothetical protein [Pseudomonas taiwanensis]